MNAFVSAGTLTRRSSSLVPSLEGVRPFLVKELREWVRSRRGLWVALTATPMMILNTLGPKIGEIAARSDGQPVPPGLSFDPTINVLARWPQWIWLYAILAGFSLLIGERDRGTLAWSLSKPLSRSGLLLGKWIAATIMFTVFGIVIPMVASVVAAAIAYGPPDLGAIAFGTLLLVATPAFFVALTLALATYLPSPAGVAGAGIGVALAPVFIGALLPWVADLFPSSIAQWAVATALDQPASVITPISALIGTVVVAALGAARLRATDL